MIFYSRKRMRQSFQRDKNYRIQMQKVINKRNPIVIVDPGFFRIIITIAMRTARIYNLMSGAHTRCLRQEDDSFARAISSTMMMRCLLDCDAEWSSLYVILQSGWRKSYRWNYLLVPQREHRKIVGSIVFTRTAIAINKKWTRNG